MVVVVVVGQRQEVKRGDILSVMVGVGDIIKLEEVVAAAVIGEDMAVAEERTIITAAEEQAVLPLFPDIAVAMQSTLPVTIRDNRIIIPGLCLPIQEELQERE